MLMNLPKIIEFLGFYIFAPRGFTLIDLRIDFISQEISDDKNSDYSKD